MNIRQTKIPILNPKITIGWLYPELMSTYGDRGNIIVLRKIAEDHNINIDILRIDQNSEANIINSCDLLFMGGAQDLQQEIVNKDLLGEKGEILRKKIENGIPGLYICGAYQFLGHYYKDSYGTKIKGLGIFDMYTVSENNKPRLIGPIVAKENGLIIGFENHGGRTYIKDSKQAFAMVVKGFGNNGEDSTEGIKYKNSIGTYMHGPLLPCNPQLAVTLLTMTIEKKYDKKVSLYFNDELAKQAKENMLKLLKLKNKY